MFHRSISAILKEDFKKYPVIAVVGPRQSGKTTLVRNLFPDLQYLLLEESDTRQRALEDPRGFLRRNSGSLILDEVQKVPELLSYIQGIVDEPNNLRKFILTGSEHLLLSEKISQTLAGRVRLFYLLPLAYKEFSQTSLLDEIFNGSYPRIFNEKLDPSTWLGQYYSTYIQQDVRSIVEVSSLEQFDRFTRLVAGRVGQLLDYSSIAADCGISPPTAKSWLSVLKASFICFTLEPHFRNFNKRIIKSPKIFFYDTGLLCYLLRIKEKSHLEQHPLFGWIFENWIISEYFKHAFNLGKEPNFYFWKDQKDHEIDLIIDEGTYLFPIEIKSSETFHPGFIKNMEYLNALQNGEKLFKPPLGICYYGGSESFSFKNYAVIQWNRLFDTI